MHKTIMVLVLVLALLPAFAQIRVTKTVKDGEVEMDVKYDEGSDVQPVFFGIYVEDITPEKAEELGYPGNSGILITGVVDGSPASNYGLQANDVLTSINGQVIENKAVFDQVRSQLRVGDTAEIKLWRGGNDEEITMVLEGRNDANVDIEKKVVEKKSGISAGESGMFYIPMWFTPDMEDVNAMVDSLGFSRFGEDGLFMQGFAIKFGVGKGFFLGGTIVSYSDDYMQPNADDPTYHDWFSYTNSFGGITLDKRVGITKHFIGSLGTTLGWGGHTVELVHSNSDYNWPANGNPFTTDNFQAKLYRSYLVVQPKVELVYNIIPEWLSFRVEAGYVYGYSTKDGWRVQGMGDQPIYVKDSPNTPFQGLTISAGPWLGF